MQDYHEDSGLNGIVLDERHVYPLAFAKQLQEEAQPIPKTAPLDFKKGELTLNPTNGDPTRFGKVSTLKVISSSALGLSEDFVYPDNVTPDPSATAVSPYSRSNEYMMNIYLSNILKPNGPDLSVVWLRNPDTTEANPLDPREPFTKRKYSQQQMHRRYDVIDQAERCES